jgi:hypothetical protein
LDPRCAEPIQEVCLAGDIVLVEVCIAKLSYVNLFAVSELLSAVLIFEVLTVSW